MVYSPIKRVISAMTSIMRHWLAQASLALFLLAFGIERLIAAIGNGSDWIVPILKAITMILYGVLAGITAFESYRGRSEKAD